MGDSKKKIVIITVCSLLLVAMVVALVFAKQDIKKSDPAPQADGNGVRVTASQKAITKICSNTDYQHTCVKTLEASGTNTTDPRKLIQIAFSSAIEEINAAANKSTVLDAVEKDPRGKAALQSCRELATRATADLDRSFNKMKEFDLKNLDVFLSDLKIWLSGSITYQETCLDGFEGVGGDSGARMRKFLNTSMEMTSNGLAMVSGLSSFVGSIVTGQLNDQFKNLLNNRRLRETLPTYDLPWWKRRLLQDSSFDPKQIKPNLVVAKDGSGDFTTINEALLQIPKKINETFTLYIKEGVYEEKVMINSSLKHLLMVGDGPTKTKITGKLNFIDGTNTYQTATVAVSGDHFTAVDMGFENSAGAEKHQAVALRVSADMAVFYNCQIDGYQDTLYAHTYRQFYRDCVISGTIDFVFGDSASIFQNCKLVLRKPMANQQNIVTAHGRKDIRQPTGIVVQNCSFVADPAYFPVRKELKSYLGRPWKEFSRTIIMESYIDDSIAAEGWLPWDRDFALKTLMYTEFNNRGPGSGKGQRLKWEGVKELPGKRVQRFTADKFVEAKKWIEATKVPYAGGFMLEVVEDDPNVQYSPESESETKDIGRVADKSTTPPKSNSTSPSLSPEPNAPTPAATLSSLSPNPNAPTPAATLSSLSPKPNAPASAPTATSSSLSPKPNVPAPTTTSSSLSPKPNAPALATTSSSLSSKPNAPAPAATSSSLSPNPNAPTPTPTPAAKAPVGVSQIAAAPSDAAVSPVSQPGGGIASHTIKKFLLTGW